MNSTLPQAAQIAADVSERAVAFQSAGCSLRGCLTLPESADGAAAVFVHGWSGYRCGPHRLFVRLARQMAADGVASLRFDLGGRGESDGDGLQASLRTMADDLAAAVDCLQRETGCQRILVVGICSGANVAIGTLPRLPKSRVAGLLLFSAYPFSEGDSFGRDVGRTWHFLRVYRAKLMQGDTWRRFWRGELDFRSIGHVLFGHFRKTRSADSAAVQQAGTAEGRTAAAAAAEGRFQKQPPTTELKKLRSDLPLLFVYGTADPDAKAARRYYQSYCVEHALPAEFHGIDGADHNFASRETEDKLLRIAQPFWRRAPGD